MLRAHDNFEYIVIYRFPLGRVESTAKSGIVFVQWYITWVVNGTQDKLILGILVVRGFLAVIDISHINLEMRILISRIG